MDGKKIKEIRYKLFMTQSKFGKAIGVSKNTVSDWENNVIGVSLRNQEKIYNLCKERNIDWDN